MPRRREEMDKYISSLLRCIRCATGGERSWTAWEEKMQQARWWFPTFLAGDWLKAARPAALRDLGVGMDNVVMNLLCSSAALASAPPSCAPGACGGPGDGDLQGAEELQGPASSRWRRAELQVLASRVTSRGRRAELQPVAPAPSMTNRSRIRSGRSTVQSIAEG
jgi:hypothetical protein